MKVCEIRVEFSIDGRLGRWVEFRGAGWFFCTDGFVFTCPAWPKPAANDQFFFGNLEVIR